MEGGAHTSGLADFMLQAGLPEAQKEVLALAASMERAAAAALGHNVTTLKGREPLARQLANRKPRRGDSYPALPVKPYLLRRGGPAALWRSGAPAKALDKWCNLHQLDLNTAEPVQPLQKRQQVERAEPRHPVWQPPAPNTLPAICIGTEVLPELRSMQEREGYAEVAAARALRQQAAERLRRQRAEQAEAELNRERSAVLEGKFSLPPRKAMTADPYVPASKSGEHFEQGHRRAREDDVRAAEQRSIRQSARAMFKRNNGCQYESITRKL